MSSRKQIQRTMHRIAQMYYLEGKSQVEIAEELQLSRPSVSRLLKKALAAGIVSIRISDPEVPYNSIAEMICEKFPVEKVIIVESDSLDRAGTFDRAAAAAAQHLASNLRDGDFVGISEGRINLRIPSFLTPLSGARSLSVLPLHGAFMYSSDLAQNNGFIASELARKLDATVHFLPTALFYDSVETRKAVERETFVQIIFSLYKKMTKALISIGDGTFLNISNSSQGPLKQTPYGGGPPACNLCSLCFDKDGNRLLTTLTDHMLGISEKSLRAVPDVIAAAVGDEKKVPTLAALRTGIIKTLITDDSIAHYLVNI